MRTCEGKQHGNTRISGGGGGAAPGARVEILLQAVVDHGEAALPLQPMGIHGDAEIHPQPMREVSMPEQFSGDRGRTPKVAGAVREVSTPPRRHPGDFWGDINPCPTPRLSDNYEVHLQPQDMSCNTQCRPCQPCGPTPLANSCNEPCVRQCQDSTVVIEPPAVLVTLPGPILSSFPQNTVVGSSTSAAVGNILSCDGVPINSGGFDLSCITRRYGGRRGLPC
ncbi:hypothetical protein DUI87_21990 [Hirundo rustica rustica]|uniref:Keratin n=1 Tax=Hirundo rustica rustica TaxID=333673 RepID=A0A3M0JL44_HIRRU|nr:hypothetical protein DUI87_21990 [Hirundo rustica rustica]